MDATKRTVELIENPELEGKTVGDKCSVEIHGIIQKVEKRKDYACDTGPCELEKSSKKQPPLKTFYTIEFSDDNSDVEGDTQEKISQIVDKNGEVDSV